MSDDVPDAEAVPLKAVKKRRAGVRQIPPSSSYRMFSGLIGVFVLALGLGAFVAIGFWGYAVLSKSRSLSTYSNVDADDKHRIREKDVQRVAVSALQGQWEAVFSGGRKAVLLLRDDQFRLIFLADSSERERHYSFGTYQFDPRASVLELRPQSWLKPPDVPGVSYHVLTNRRYKLLAGFPKGDEGRLFLKPFVNPKLHDQVHPLFFRLGREDRFIVWSKNDPDNAEDVRGQ